MSSHPAAMPALSLQRRVTLALALLVSLFVILQGTLAYLSVEEQEDELVDELVLTEARGLATQIGDEGGEVLNLLRLSPHFSGWLVLSNGKSIPDDMPPALLRFSDGPHRPEAAGQEVHVYVMPTKAGRLYLQYDASDNEAKVHEFGLYQIGLCLLCIVFGVALSHYIAAVVVAPIERLTRLLSDWAPHTVTDETPLSDEESRLFDAFSRVQARFEQVLADERAFVANVSHELRTPLAALRTELEMLLLESDTQANASPRLHNALRHVDVLAGALNLTRTLTHAQVGEAVAVDIATCVDDAWASLGSLPESRGLQLDNQVVPGLARMLDRHALLTILRNLMRNAAEHAAPALCRVSWSERGLEIADNGPGIASSDLPFVFERYYQGRRSDSGADNSADISAENQGLGLAIACQVADLNGWLLSVEAAQPQGSCFILKLPAD